MDDKVDLEKDNTKINESTTPSLYKEIFDWIMHIVLAIVIALLISNYVFQMTVVAGKSMEPTLEDGNRLAMEKITPRFGKLHHDDVVIIDAKDELYILRRMSKAIEALGEPLTIAETCRAVYGEMSGYNQLLVIEKTGAYVEYLYEHGMIEITNPDEVEQGKPARYRRLREISESEILPKERAYVFV